MSNNHGDEMQDLVAQAYQTNVLGHEGIWWALFGEGDSRRDCGFFARHNDGPWPFHGGEADRYMNQFC